jgi:hypothetical protein
MSIDFTSNNNLRVKSTLANQIIAAPFRKKGKIGLRLKTIKR